MSSNRVVVPVEEYDRAIEVNRKLLEENTDLKMQISHLQKELAKLREANLYVN